MFTGIIEAKGSIAAITPMGVDSRFVFNTGTLNLDDMQVGDSIAVNGACLTIIEKDSNAFSADLSGETLALTCFADLEVGAYVNLEKAMQLSDRINGHMVSGHVDAIGVIRGMHDEGRSWRCNIEVPEALVRYISRKGSVTVDGVSLTVNQVEQNTFSVNIIPHTYNETIFSDYQPGTRVNIEVDMIARYLEQLLADRKE
ncbi:MAG: riboflavin synthase [Gammaproteobacteria bacterium]